jgi:hypothetical protein
MFLGLNEIASHKVPFTITNCDTINIQLRKCLKSHHSNTLSVVTLGVVTLMFNKINNAYYRECCRMKLWEEIRPNINCTVVPMDIFFNKARNSSYEKLLLAVLLIHHINLY